MSGLVPNLAQCVDDMAFLPAMIATSNVHGPATFMQTTGFVLPGFPSMGSWVSYGLGTERDSLPTFVVLPDSRGFAPGGPKNWAAGFLPSSHQGTLIRPAAENPIADLFPPPGEFVTRAMDRDGLAALTKLNRVHEAARPGDSRLDARDHRGVAAARFRWPATDDRAVPRVEPGNSRGAGDSLTWESSGMSRSHRSMAHADAVKSISVDCSELA